MSTFTLARATVDIGLFSDNPAMAGFYMNVLGLPFVEALPHSDTYSENFYAANGASLKINASTEPMEPGTSGYRGLIIAREGITGAQRFVDPDGLAVTIVAPGHDGVHQMGIVCEVPDVAAERAFLVEGVGAHDDEGVLRIGETAFFLRRGGVSRPTPTWPNSTPTNCTAIWRWSATSRRAKPRRQRWRRAWPMRWSASTE